MTCPNCRRENPQGSSRCIWCGGWLAAGSYPYAPAAAYGPPYKPPGNPDQNWMAITGMVCGIVSILCSPSLFGGLFLGAAAIMFSVMGMKSARRGMAIAGLICGVVGLLAVVIFFPLLYKEFVRQITEQLG